MWRTAKQRKRTSLRPPTVETGVLFIGRGVAYRKTGLHGLLFIHHLLPCSSLHGLLFIHRRPPPASTCDCSSTVDLLQPPPATVHPRAHVHLASTDYCSTSPPRAT